MAQPKIEAWEILATIGVLFFGGLYIYHHVDFEDLLTPNPPQPVHMEGKIAKTKRLKDVQVVPIPKEVYDAIEMDSQGSKYILGNKKYIVVLTGRGFPQLSAYRNKLSDLYRNKGFSEYYRKHFIETNGFTYRNENCPLCWLWNNCLRKVCLINPAKRIAVIDSSLDVEQLPILLEKYKDW